MGRAQLKFNNANLAIICPKCRVILKTGRDFSDEENKYARGELRKLPEQYCKDCKIKC